MALVNITPNDVAPNGSKLLEQPTVGILSTGDVYLIPNDGRTFFIVSVASTTTTVTVAISRTVDGGLVVDDKDIVMTDETLILGGFTTLYGEHVSVSFDQVSGVNFQVGRTRWLS